MNHRNGRKLGHKDRLISIEQDGEYLSAQIEVDGKLFVGKYMRYGWDGPARTAEQEVQRLLKMKTGDYNSRESLSPRPRNSLQKRLSIKS